MGFDEEIKCHLWDEQTWSGTGRVAYGSADILVVEVLGWIEGIECVAVDVIEDVVYASSTREFFCTDVHVGSFDGGNKISGELGHEPEDESALLVLVTVNGGISEGIEFLLGLAHQRVQSGFHIWKLLPNVVHENLEGMDQGG